MTTTERQNHPSAPAGPAAIDLTVDERRILWDFHYRLDLRNLASSPDRAIAYLRSSRGSGGDYSRGYQLDRTGITAEWRDWIVRYDPAQPCTHRCTGPTTAGWLFHCAPGARGHAIGCAPRTDRTHTARLTWTRLRRWIGTLTISQRTELAAQTEQDLHWTMLALIGPRPAEPFDQPDAPHPATPSAQLSLF